MSCWAAHPRESRGTPRNFGRLQRCKRPTAHPRESRGTAARLWPATTPRHLTPSSPRVAGNTLACSRAASGSSSAQVFPASRGEQPARTAAGTCPGAMPGSSPRVAGNTRSAPARPATVPAHPRECGEHATMRMLMGQPAGSSPRVRGTPCAFSHRQAGVRLIPASAGNTMRPRSYRHRSSAHPRECGEHSGGFRDGELVRGSSPRVRGTHHLVVAVERHARLIPASAGNTPPGRSAASASAAHPRECGEHIDLEARDPDAAGSSPRVRGTR